MRWGESGRHWRRVTDCNSPTLEEKQIQNGISTRWPEGSSVAGNPRDMGRYSLEGAKGTESCGFHVDRISYGIHMKTLWILITGLLARVCHPRSDGLIFFFILIGHISRGNEICILVKGNGRAGVWRGASHHCQYSPLLARGRWSKDILLLQ